MTYNKPGEDYFMKKSLNNFNRVYARSCACIGALDGYHRIGFQTFSILALLLMMTAMASAPSPSYAIITPQPVLHILSNTTDGSTEFVDTSASAHAVLPQGNVHHGDSSKFGGSTAICFDGSGDYLKLPKSNDWSFGTGDFTIDVWLNFSLINRNYQGIFSAAPATNGYFMCCYNGKFMWYHGATGWMDTGFKPVAGQWYHLVVARSGNTLSIYVNGEMKISRSCAGASFDSSRNGFVIGSMSVSPPKSYFYGYIDEITIYKGFCVPDAAKFTILHTSDIHDHASGYGPFRDYTPDGANNDGVLGGYARLATLIGAKKTAQGGFGIPSLLFDSGDYFMGTTYDMTASDPIALKFFAALGYDAITLGNHEFDWGPAGLAMLLNNAMISGNPPVFDPILDPNGTAVLATNMEPNGSAQMNAMIAAGVLVNKRIMTLPNGIKVGLLGLMGPGAEQDAPVRTPVTFNHDYAFIQSCVDNLTAVDGVDLVIVLSHGGVELDGSGDDADLADNVTGMDIIASGHYHTEAPAPAIVGGSIIISPGKYGKTLGQLDVTYSPSLDLILGYDFTLIPVNDATPGFPAITGMVNAYNASINSVIGPLLGVQLNTILSSTAFPLEKADFQVTGFGSLCADSLRNVANAVAPLNGLPPFEISVIGSGTIRDGIYPGNTGAVSFTDAYNALPLGASPFDSSTPGYPLMSIYAYGYEVWTMCEVGMTISHMFGADFFLNFSGLQIVYDPVGAATFSGVQAVNVYSPADPFCTGAAAPINMGGLYHIAVGLYEMQMLTVVNAFLPPPGIQPRNADGSPMVPAQYAGARIDASANAGVQELKEWLALVQYLPTFGGAIPAPIYGPGGLATGDLRVDYLP